MDRIRKIKRNGIAVVTAILMVLAVIPNLCDLVRAEVSVTYIERYGGGVEATKTAPDDAVFYNGQGTLSSGWYIVDKNLTYNGRIEVRGDVKLILVDGASLTVKEGIRLAEGNTLTIYGQVGDSGKLYAHGSKYNAGIGANDADDDEESAAGTIIIHGGTIEARGGSEAAGIGGGNESRGGDVTIYGGYITAYGTRFGAGIGGGDEADNGKTEIYGGTVTASGGAEGGAGIGGGDGGGSGGVITIYNGFVTAEGKWDAAAIGGGEEGSSGTITINAGSVTAYANHHHPNRGAGIGSGSEADQGGVITINGGIISAYSGNGAGIGAGYNADGGTININQGLVVATSIDGAGIGGGAYSGLFSTKGNGGTTTITGGVVIAASTQKGAGIGGGNDGKGGTVNISGGHVTATGGYIDYPYWSASINPDYMDALKGLPKGGNPWRAVADFIADLIFAGKYAGAGIGGGDGDEGANMTITGGTVIAKSGMESTPAIGHGDGDDENGSLSVYSSSKVTCGNLNSDGSPAQDSTPVAAASRETAPHARPFAVIEPCDHPGAVFENVGAEGHLAHCSYCTHPDSEILPHEFDESGHLCVKCGYERVLITLRPGDGTGEVKSFYVDKDAAYILPPCTFIPPEGKSFIGWRASGGGIPEDVYPAGISVTPTSDLTLTAQWSKELTITVVGTADIKTYTGEELSVTGYELHCDDESFKEENVRFSGNAAATGTDVRDYPMGLKAEQFSYDDPEITATFEVVDGILTIVPAKLIIEVTGHIGAVPYDGDTHRVEGYETECEDTLFDANDVNFTGDAVAQGIEAGIYPMGLDAANFTYDDSNIDPEFRVTDGWLRIYSPGELAFTIVGHKDIEIYDSSEQSVTGYDIYCSSEYDPDKFHFTGDATAKGTDADYYPMGLSAEKFRYNDTSAAAHFEVIDGGLTIEKAKLDIIVKGSQEAYTYDGQAHTAKGYTAGCDSQLYAGDRLSYDGTASVSGTDVGTYPMGIDAAKFIYEDSNTIPTFYIIDGWLKIDLNPVPKKLTITVDGNADTRVYNGVEQRFYGTFTAAGSDPEFDVNKFHYLGSTTVSGKDTGDYEVNPKEAMCIYDEEYAITWIMGNPINLTITPAEITIHVTGHTNTVTYNGSEQRVEGYDLICEEGFYERALVSFTGEAVAKGTAASEEKYMMGLAESLFGYSDTNVKAAFVIEDGWLKIDPAPDPGPGPGPSPDPSPDPSPEPRPDPDPPHPAAWTIIYDLNGGTYNGSFGEIIETYPDGAVISIHEAPSREGYTFRYWMGSEYQPGDRYTVTENHTFTAIWQNNRNHRGDSDLPDTRDNFRADRWILMMGISTLMSLISVRMLRLYR